MSDLKTKLFSRKKTWFAEAYETTEEAFLVAEYFARYAKKRWPFASETTDRNPRGYLYLEEIDVVFCSLDKVPRKVLKLGYGSSVLQVLLPNLGYTEEQKEILRDFYQRKYAPILKESHARTNALLWHTFSEAERREILRAFRANSQTDLKIKKDVLRDITKIIAGNESEIIKMQTRTSTHKKVR
ncbi:MAG TPA: hypothetical protein VIG33_03395, partial [Pseudobdellovibrionaceae bacterium]